MKKFIKSITYFAKCNYKSKNDVLLIIFLCLKVSYIIRRYPLKKYYNRFFLHDNVKPIDLMPYKKDINMIKKVLKNLPGEHTCLKESIIVHLFFKIKGINIPLFLGVITKDEFLAHAWYDIDNANGYNQV